MQEAAIHEVTAVSVRQIDSLQTDLSEQGIFITETVDVHVGRNAQRLLGLDEMRIAVQEAAQTRDIRDDAGELAKIQAVDGEREVLQRLLVGRRIKLQSRAIICQQVHIGIDMVVPRQHDEVLGIEVELTIGDDGIQRIQVNGECVIGDRALETQVNALASALVKINKVQARDAVLVEAGIELAVKRELRIATAVVNTGIHTNARRILIDICLNGIKEDSSCVQLVDMTFAIDAHKRVQVDVEQDVLKAIVHRLRHVMQEVLVASMELHVDLRQTLCQGFFVNLSDRHLAIEFCHEEVQLCKQFVVACMTTDLETQVAAAECCMGFLRI